MKKCSIGIALISVAVIATGCMTGGAVIGPVSYLTAKHNETKMNQRAILNAQLAPEKKAQLFKAMEYTGDGRGVVVGMGVDLMAIPDVKMTTGEVVMNALGAVADTALYGGVAWGVTRLSDSNNRSGSGNVEIHGNVTDSNISNVKDNSGSVSDPQAARPNTITKSE